MYVVRENIKGKSGVRENQFSNNLPTNEELTVEMEMIIILGKLQ